MLLIWLFFHWLKRLNDSICFVFYGIDVVAFVLHLLRLCVLLSLPPHYTCSRKNGIPRDLITCRCILLKQPWCSYYYPMWASESQPLRSVYECICPLLFKHSSTPHQLPHWLRTRTKLHLSGIMHSCYIWWKNSLVRSSHIASPSLDTHCRSLWKHRVKLTKIFWFFRSWNISSVMLDSASFAWRVSWAIFIRYFSSKCWEENLHVQGKKQATDNNDNKKLKCWTSGLQTSKDLHCLLLQ